LKFAFHTSNVKRSWFTMRWSKVRFWNA